MSPLVNFRCLPPVPILAEDDITFVPASLFLERVLLLPGLCLGGPRVFSAYFFLRRTSLIRRNPPLFTATTFFGIFSTAFSLVGPESAYLR